MELLVVLVVIAVAVSSTFIALKRDTRSLVQEEGARLALLLDLAREEASLGSVAMAWVGFESGYEFQRRDLTDLGPEWRVLTGDELLRPRQFPHGIHLRGIQLDGVALATGQRLNLGNQDGSRMTVEIGLGETRVRITEVDGRFQANLVREERS